jgi:hypothetical protein
MVDGNLINDLQSSRAMKVFRCKCSDLGRDSVGEKLF